MRIPTLTACLMILPSVVAAQSFEAGREGYVWKQGNELIRFDKGRWTAGLADGRRVSWHMFFWHDKWVYDPAIARGHVLVRGATLTV